MQTCSSANGTGSSKMKTAEANARGVSVTTDALAVDLVDGRTVTVPVAWYPRLAHGAPEARENWRLIGGGEGIHWPDLDEDIAIQDLIAGRGSGESQDSLRSWIEARARAG